MGYIGATRCCVSICELLNICIVARTLPRAEVARQLLQRVRRKENVRNPKMVDVGGNRGPHNGWNQQRAHQTAIDPTAVFVAVDLNPFVYGFVTEYERDDG